MTCWPDYKKYIYLSNRKMPVMSLAGAMTMAKNKKKMAAEARENVEIKKEEQSTKRVKTILDKEAADMEREKLQEKKQVNVHICF